MNNILNKCPVPILQSPWEFNLLLSLYSGLQPRKVVEIGSFYGGTLWFWTQSNNGQILDSLTSVDYPIGPSDSRYEEMIYSRAHWPSWMKGTTDKFNDIQGDSHAPAVIEQVHSLYPNNDVEFLFIDGDHSYSGVKADFDNYSPLVNKGIIAIHDICGLPEVKMFWEEIRISHKTMEIHEPDGWGIGIIEK